MPGVCVCVCVCVCVWRVVCLCVCIIVQEWYVSDFCVAWRKNTQRVIFYWCMGLICPGCMVACTRTTQIKLHILDCINISKIVLCVPSSISINTAHRTTLSKAQTVIFTLNQRLCQSCLLVREWRVRLWFFHHSKRLQKACPDHHIPKCLTPKTTSETAWLVVDGLGNPPWTVMKGF